MSTTTLLLPFQPDAMSPGQLAAVSYLARYSGHTHKLYTFQLRRWFRMGARRPTSSCTSAISALAG
jgi:hypothetical protein